MGFCRHKLYKKVDRINAKKVGKSDRAKRLSLLLLLLFFFNVALTARSLATTAPLDICVVVYVFEIF